MTTSPKLWAVVNIGCIECGVTSTLVGVFDDEQQAEAIRARLQVTHNWRQGGQNAFQVFPVGPVNTIDPEYAE